MSKYYLWNMAKNGLSKLTSVTTGSHGHTATHTSHPSSDNRAKEVAVTAVSPTGEYIFRYSREVDTDDNYIAIHQSQSSLPGGFHFGSGKDSTSVVFSSIAAAVSLTDRARMSAKWISTNEVAVVFRSHYGEMADTHTLQSVPGLDPPFPSGQVNGAGGNNYEGLFFILSGSDSTWRVSFWHTGSDSATTIQADQVQMLRGSNNYDGIAINHEHTEEETNYIALYKRGIYSDSVTNAMTVFKKDSGEWGFYSNVYYGRDQQTVIPATEVVWVGNNQDHIAISYRQDASENDSKLFLDIMEPKDGDVNTKKYVSKAGYVNSYIHPDSIAWDPYRKAFLAWYSSEIFIFDSGSGWIDNAVATSLANMTAPAGYKRVHFSATDAYRPVRLNSSFSNHRVQWRFRSGSIAAMYSPGKDTSGFQGKLQFIESGSYGWLGRNAENGTSQHFLNWGFSNKDTFFGQGTAGTGSVKSYLQGPSTTTHGFTPIVMNSIGQSPESPWQWVTTKGASGDVFYFAEGAGNANDERYSGRNVLVNLGAYQGVTPEEWVPLSSHTSGETSYELSSSALSGIAFTPFTSSGEGTIAASHAPAGGKFSPSGLKLARFSRYGGDFNDGTTVNAGLEIFHSSSDGWQFHTFLSGTSTGVTIRDFAWASEHMIWSTQHNHAPVYWISQSADSGDGPGWNVDPQDPPALVQANNGGSGATSTTYINKVDRLLFSRDRKFVVFWSHDDPGFHIRKSGSLSSNGWSGKAWRMTSYDNFEWAGKLDDGRRRLIGVRQGGTAMYLSFIDPDDCEDIGGALGNTTGPQSMVMDQVNGGYAGQFMHWHSASDSLLYSVHGANSPGDTALPVLAETKIAAWDGRDQTLGRHTIADSSGSYANSVMQAIYVPSITNTAGEAEANEIFRTHANKDYLFSGSSENVSGPYFTDRHLESNPGRDRPDANFRSFRDPNTDDRVFIGTARYSSQHPAKLKVLERGSDGWKLATVFEWDNTIAASTTPAIHRHFDFSAQGELVVPVTGSNYTGFAVARIAGTGGGDSTAPTVSSVAITSATNSQNNLLNTGDVVSVTVTFDEAVTVNVGGGTPAITISVGGQDRSATYASGTGTTAIVFTYTIASENADTDGISIAANQISLNSGTIKDAAGNDATLTHSAVSANSSFKVDTTAPTISSLSMAANNSTVTVTFSEDVYTNSNGTGELAASDFAVSLAGGNSSNINDPSAISISNLSKTSQSIYVLTLSATDLDSIALGTETLTVDSASDTAIYDLAGNAHTAAATVSLNNTAAINNSVATTIGTGGGTIKAGNTSVDPDATLTVQAGSVNGNVEFTVDVTPESSPFKNGLSARVHSVKAASKVIRITPHGTRFNADKPVTIKFKLTDTTAGTKVVKRNVPDGPWYDVPSDKFSRDGDEITIQSLSLSDYQAYTGDSNMARTILNNAQLAKLTQQNKVSGDSVDITGSTGVRTGIAASDQFLVQSLTLGVPMQVSASVMRSFFSDLEVETTDVSQAHRVVFAEHTGSTPGLKVDASTFTFNPSTDTLTVTKLGAFEAAGAINFANQDMTNVDIDSGAIDGVIIGGASAAAGTFTSLVGTGLDINGAADISGDLTLSAGGAGALRFSVASSVMMLDNDAASLVIETADGNDYLTFDTQNGSEQVIIHQNVSLSDKNLTNVGDVALDSISADGSSITVSSNSTFAGTTIADLGTVSAATSITSTAFVGPIDGVVGGSNPAAGTFTTLVAGGNVDLGDATSDTITATGRFDSDLVPSTDSARALGTSDFQWSAVHVDVGHIDQLGSALNANSQAITNINVDSGAIDGATLGANSAVTIANADMNGGSIDGVAIGASSATTGVFTTVDATTDVTVGSLVVTDDQIQMTPSPSDTVTIAGATNGALNITTVDLAGEDANLLMTIDGTAEIASAGLITLDSGAGIALEPAAGSAILLDGTISVDAGVVTGATSITSTAFVGSISGGSLAGTTLVATGDVDLGNATSDTITANGRFDSDLVPSTDNAHDLGADGVEWKDLYLDGVAYIDTIGSTSDKVGLGHFSALSASHARVENLDVININTVTQTETHLAIVDKVIMVASGSNGASTTGAGLQIGGHAEGDDVASILYDDALNTDNGGFDFNIDGTTFLSLHEGAIVPATDNAVDLGTSTLEFKDLFLDGTATADALALASGATVTAILDEDNFASDSATALATQQSIKAFVTANGGNFFLEDDSGDEVQITNSKEIKFIGSGITTNWTDTSHGTDGDPYDLTFTVDAAQTGITSVLNASLVIGRDADNDIDFSTDNQITLRAGGEDQLKLVDGALTPSQNAIVDLGTDALEFKDLYIDGTAYLDAVDIDGGAIDGVTLGGNAQVTITSADMNGGSIDSVVIGGATPAAGTFTALQANDSLVVNANASIVGDAAGEVQLNVKAHASQSTSIFNVELQDGTDKLTVSSAGVTTAASLVATTADINGGAIDTTVIGGSTPAAGTFTTLDCNDGAFAVANLDIDGATDIGAALADADLIMVDDGAGGTNRKSAVSRIPTYVFTKVTGDATIDSSGALSLAGDSVGANELANGVKGDGVQITDGVLRVDYVEQTYLHSRHSGSSNPEGTAHQTQHGYSVMDEATSITASLSAIPLDNSLQVYLNGLLQTRSGSAGNTFDYEFVADTTPRKIYLVSAIDEDDVLVLKYIKK